MRIETEKVGYRDVGSDVLCGIIMILIVLDHTRDFFFDFLPNPTNINDTTPFFKRWITYFWAPGFLLQEIRRGLMGPGAGGLD